MQAAVVGFEEGTTPPRYRPGLTLASVHPPQLSTT
jgi:hypothetical protein